VRLKGTWNGYAEKIWERTSTLNASVKECHQQVIQDRLNARRSGWMEGCCGNASLHSHYLKEEYVSKHMSPWSNASWSSTSSNDFDGNDGDDEEENNGDNKVGKVKKVNKGETVEHKDQTSGENRQRKKRRATNTLHFDVEAWFNVLQQQRDAALATTETASIKSGKGKYAIGGITYSCVFCNKITATLPGLRHHVTIKHPHHNRIDNWLNDADVSSYLDDEEDNDYNDRHDDYHNSYRNSYRHGYGREKEKKRLERNQKRRWKTKRYTGLTSRSH
jgi:hypothetical protein